MHSPGSGVMRRVARSARIGCGCRVDCVIFTGASLGESALEAASRTETGRGIATRRKQRPAPKELTKAPSIYREPVLRAAVVSRARHDRRLNPLIHFEHPMSDWYDE